MALDAGSVYATLGGRFSPHGFQLFGTAMARARNDMERHEKAMTASQARVSKAAAALGTAAKVTAVGGILALGATLVSSVKKAADFEQQLNVLQATSNATAAQMRRLSATAKQLGADTTLPATSAKDAADAMTELAKGGLKVNDTMKAARGVLQLSAAAQISNAEAARTVADALNAFGLSGQEAVRVADLLANAANATTASIPEMAQALQQSSAAAHALGIPIDELVTMLGQLANAGIKGSDAGTSVKTMLAALTPNSNAAADTIKKLGVDVFTSQGKFVGIRDTIRQYHDALVKLNPEQRQTAIETIFGSDASRAANIILHESVTAHDKLHGAMVRHGAAADLAKAQTKGFKGAVEGFKSALETAQITIGQAFLPMLTKAMQGASKFVSHLDSSGKLDQWATGLANGAVTAAHVLADVAHVGGQVAGVLIDIGRALNLGDPATLEAILAAVIGFKAVNFIGPIVLGLAGSIKTLVLAARTAPTIGAFLADIGLAANPVGAAALAVGALAAAIVILSSRESHEEQVAKRVAAAKREQKAAVDALAGAERGDVDKKLAAQRGTLDVKQAEQDFLRVSRAHKQGKASALELADAELRLQEASARSAAAHRDYNVQLDHTEAAQRRVRNAANRRLGIAQDEVARARALVAGDQAHGGAARPESVAALAKAQREYAAAMRAFGEANAQASAAEANRQRIEANAPKLRQENIRGVNALIAAMDEVKLPKEIRTRLIADDQDALSKIGGLALTLNGMGRKQTVLRILTTAPNAKSALAALDAVVRGLPTSKALKILHNAPSAAAAVQAFKAIVAGVPATKAMRILHNADSATQAIRDLKHEIDLLKDKQITITTLHLTKTAANKRSGNVTKASGRGPGGQETALIGEGGEPEWRVNPDTGMAYRTAGPELVDLAAGDYVIPTESRHRGRALGLIAALAADLGIGFARGKKGHKTKAKAKPRPVPAAIALGGVPFADVEADYTRSREAYQAAKKDVTSNVHQRDAAQHRLDRVPKTTKHHNYDRQRSNAADTLKKKEKDLRDARAHLHRLEPGFRKAEAYWREAKKTDDETKGLESQINLASDRMNDANRVDDQAGYDAARTGRQGYIRSLIVLLQKALGLANPKSQHARTLRELLSQYGGDKAVQGIVPAAGAEGTFGGVLGDAAPSDTEQEAAKPGETEADRIKQTGMTDVEAGRLADIERDIALAGLTPDLADDRAAAGSKVGFLETLLGEALAEPRRGGSPFIAQVARDLKTARDDVTALTSGGATVQTPDLQAQLDQERQRRGVAERERDIANQAVGVFGGPGDIGTGGPNARAAVVQNFHMMFPGTPDEQQRLGQAAVSGMSFQPSRTSPRERLGF